MKISVNELIKKLKVKENNLASLDKIRFNNDISNFIYFDFSNDKTIQMRKDFFAKEFNISKEIIDINYDKDNEVINIKEAV